MKLRWMKLGLSILFKKTLKSLSHVAIKFHIDRGRNNRDGIVTRSSSSCLQLKVEK